MLVGSLYSLTFPAVSPALQTFGLKFSSGGAHISRTMMLAELDAVLSTVPVGSDAADYREAILQRNILGKTTDSTRQKSLRHLRELYALDESIPLFGILRKLHTIDAASLPLLALQVAWARDPLLRATTLPVMDASEGERVETASLALALNATFPDQYSELNSQQNSTKCRFLLDPVRPPRRTNKKDPPADQTLCRGYHHGIFPGGHRRLLWCSDLFQPLVCTS